ncbi:MAG: LuxR C-terminal-related transcriptional regulator [Bacteriodetes bacterium]|nr:LuxR C-terminal-related transcriptional regulator [Bacteroidota bacterium]
MKKKLKQNNKDNEMIEMQSLCAEAEVIMKAKDKKRIRVLLNSITAMAKNSRNLNVQLYGYKYAMETYEAIEDYEKALEYCKPYYDAEAQLQREEAEVKVKGLEKELNLAELQHNVELEKLKTEELQLELESKNNELSTLALALAQKNELLARMQTQLLVAQETVRRKSEKEALEQLKTQITSFLSSEKSWYMFDQQFKTIHHDFVQKLSAKYPQLSPIELRVCALLKVNLNSKEIADILCVETKSVEMYRFRIRKKIALDNTVNLHSYILGLNL